jgi:hypothetical protein
MKQSWMKLFLAFGSICLGGTVLQAQSYNIKADVPFAFHAKGVDLPAGTYTVSRSGASGVEYIKDSRGLKAAILANNATENKGTTRLVFRCYGNEKFLAEIWGTDGTGNKIPVSKQEREAMERPAGRDVATITVNATVAP